MGSGARLRSDNEASGRSRSGAFLISFAPAPSPSSARVPAAWDYVNAPSSFVPSDMCEDRVPPDPTPGPDRPDLGNFTHRSRFSMWTQCFIRDFTPGYQMQVIANAGDPDEFILIFDLATNGLPLAAFSNYDPLTQYVFKNNVNCYAILTPSADLPRAAGNGGAGADYDRFGANPGYPFRFEFFHWDGTLLPTAFGRNLEVELQIQAPVPITAFAYEGTAPPLQVATSVAHGLTCGSAVRIFDTETVPNEITIRIGEVTADTFKWNLFFFDEWVWGPTAQWEPAYDAAVDHVSTC